MTRAFIRAFLDTPEAACFLAALFASEAGSEAHVPAEQGPPHPRTRVSQAQRHQGGAERSPAAPRQGSQATRHHGEQEVAAVSFVTGFAFPKTARLLRRAGFLVTREKGRSFSEGPLAASFRARQDETARTGSPTVPLGPRVGLTVSSRVGGAVVRNRIKRRLREAVRHELRLLPPVDLVLVARASASSATVEELRLWLRKAAARMRGG
jgi:ribonuclease P protein component